MQVELFFKTAFKSQKHINYSIAIPAASNITKNDIDRSQFDLNFFQLKFCHFSLLIFWNKQIRKKWFANFVDCDMIHKKIKGKNIN